MCARERLKKARKTLGITQESMGNPIGLKKENIRDLESGKVKFSTLHALSLENIFNISSKWLLNGQGEMFRGDSNISLESYDKTVSFDDIVEAEHLRLIKLFKNKELAKNINHKLINLEQKNPTELYEVEVFIDFRLSKTDTKKSKQPGRGEGKVDRRKKA